MITLSTDYDSRRIILPEIRDTDSDVRASTFHQYDRFRVVDGLSLLENIEQLQLSLTSLAVAREFCLPLNLNPHNYKDHLQIVMGGA